MNILRNSPADSCLTTCSGKITNTNTGNRIYLKASVVLFSNIRSNYNRLFHFR